MLIKRIVNILGISLGTVVLLVLLYLAAAYTLSRIAVNKNVESSTNIGIYILSNGVHTDIVVPIKSNAIDWSDYVKYEFTQGKDTSANLVAFGWGDKGFYLETPTWADLKFSVAFRAAFGLSTSAIHTTFYKQLSENDKCKSIQISNAEYTKLCEYILNSFQMDSLGNLINIDTDANYGDNDAFYEAIGSYTILRTCNTWTNDGLKSCGQKASLWTPFDTGIFYHYNK